MTGNGKRYDSTPPHNCTTGRKVCQLLECFCFILEFFFKGSFFFTFFLIYQTKQIVFAGNSSSPLNLAFRIFTYRRLGTSLFDETFEERPEKSIATALKIQTG